MKVIFLIVVIFLLAGLVMMAMKKGSGNKTAGMPKMSRKKPLTNTEQTLYFSLVEALPEMVILCQVQTSQIITIANGTGKQAWFNKISRKSVDFLVCEKDFTIVTAIELDDKSHQLESRKKADQDKDAALSQAGIPLKRFNASKMPSVEQIREAVTDSRQNRPS